MQTRLTEHFSVEELTSTSNGALQAANRILTGAQMAKLLALAEFGERIREICAAAVCVHSGYRCPTLNGATLGSSKTSQHQDCEALDLDVVGQTPEQTFNILCAAARAGKFRFGQLILEEADRGYATVKWIHASVIGTLNPAKVGQAMEMKAGPDGKQHYVMVQKFNFSQPA
jgi:hypothetical protein